MVLPPEVGPRRPLLVRFALGGIQSRTTAWRYVWISAGLLLFAAAIGDPTLIGIALLGIAAFSGSIWWMDRHAAWDREPAAPAEPASIPAAAAGTAMSDASDVAAPPPTTAPTPLPDLRARLLDPVTTPSPAAALGSGIATVAFLAALVSLESAGPAPTGTHLVAVVINALFGVVFGGAATFIALRRPHVPFERALTLLAATGLALVASLGFFVAGDGQGTPGAAGLGPAVGVLILALGSGAAFWLTARSGSWVGWAAALPVLLLGWYLGLAAWIAHVNSA